MCGVAAVLKLTGPLARRLREVRQILAASPDFAFELVNQDLDSELDARSSLLRRDTC